MSACFDVDEAMTLCSALRWEPDEILSHLEHCSACRQQLREVAALHGVLALVEPLSETWIAETNRRIAAEAPALDRGPIGHFKERLELWVLAGGTAVTVLLPPASQPGAGFSLPAALGVSALFALLASRAAGFGGLRGSSA